MRIMWSDPMVWRSGLISTRVRFYHQSSHLGDEFLLGNPGSAPWNLAMRKWKDFFHWIPLEVGHACMRWRLPRTYEAETRSLKVQWGLELRGPTYNASVYGAFLPDLRIVPILGADFKTFQELDWALNTNLVAGIELYRVSGSRRFRV